jgi:hypothetical protein
MRAKEFITKNQASEYVYHASYLPNQAYGLKSILTKGLQPSIKEAFMDPDVRSAFEQQGYKFLDSGVDQDVFLAPDGTILKIFGSEEGSAAGSYTKGQQSFIDFANYCMAHPNNLFLPEFTGIEQFEFKGRHYLKIGCERLFEINQKHSSYLSLPLETIESLLHRPAGFIIDYIEQQIEHDIDGWGDDEEFAQFILYIGGVDQLSDLIITMKDLQRISLRRGYRFDLHTGNFMLGSDGNIVINDPFFTGTDR